MTVRQCHPQNSKIETLGESGQKDGSNGRRRHFKPHRQSPEWAIGPRDLHWSRYYPLDAKPALFCLVEHCAVQFEYTRRCSRMRVCKQRSNFSILRRERNTKQTRTQRMTRFAHGLGPGKHRRKSWGMAGLAGSTRAPILQGVK